MTVTVPNGVPSAAPQDASYEGKAASLMAIGFGAVGLDRFIINPLFPTMQKDLGLSYQDLGLISAIFALTWGLSSIFSGRLADRVGRKRVIVPAVVLFSVLVATTGRATGLVSLLFVRAVMCLAEGAYLPASIVTTVDASHPKRIGLNLGIQQMGAPLVGLGLGPRGGPAGCLAKLALGVRLLGAAGPDPCPFSCSVFCGPMCQRSPKRRVMPHRISWTR
jgi:MFS family permease